MGGLELRRGKWVLLLILFSLFLGAKAGKAESDYKGAFRGIKSIGIVATVTSPSVYAPKMETEDYLVNLAFLGLKKNLPEDVVVVKGFEGASSILRLNVLLDNRSGGGYYGMFSISLVRIVVPLEMPSSEPFLATAYSNEWILTGREGALDQIKSMLEQSIVSFSAEFIIGQS